MIVLVPNHLTLHEDDGGAGSVYTMMNGNLISVPTNDRPSIITRFFVPLMAAKVNSNAYIYAPSLDNAYTKARSYIQHGSTSEMPKDLLVNSSWKIPSNNYKDWIASKSDPTIIVVAPYEIGNIKIVVTPNQRSDIMQNYYSYAHPTFFEVGQELVASGPAKGMVHSGGYYISAHRGFIRVYWDRISRTWEQPVLGTSISYIKETFLNNMCIDPALVTSTVAEADTACMDVLTAVAELPETVASILSGLKLVISAIRDLKKGRLAISNAHLRKKESDAALHRLTMRRLNDKLSNSSSPRERKHWQRKISQENKRMVNVRQSAAIEFNSALASIWMNFRYNIMPAVYTIEDLQSLIDSYSAMFKTTRDSLPSSFQFDLDSWTGSYDIAVRQGCVIKRLIDPNLRFTSLTKANFASTAWELIPLSFVVDWFINIGDVISSLTSPNLSLREGATYSSKINESLTFYKEGSTSHLQINVQIFKRRVIDPMSHIGLSFNTKLSTFQKIDSLALLWNPIKSQLQRSKRN